MTPLAVALAAILALLALVARTLLRRRGLPARAEIRDPDQHTTIDADGAVRSTQAADLTMSREQLDRIWSPEHLERLARTYWRFLSRCTLGLIRVEYGEQARTVVLVRSPLRLLRFGAPEYEMDADRGIVRWRIQDGLLVSRRGRGGDGYLEIDVQRRPSDREDCVIAHVEVEVANFYPAIASSLSRPVYSATQASIHVLVTHGFLRSLARLDLAESHVGRFSPRSVDAVPNPPPAPEPREGARR